MVLYIILSFSLVVFLFMSLSVYIKSKPPKSVILVAFRMPYQIMAVFLTIVCMLGIVFYFSIILFKGKSIKPYSLFLVFGFLIISILGIVYSARINNSKAIQYGVAYDYSSTRKKYVIQNEDLKEITSMKQCDVYCPKDSLKASTCVIYLNYGGWSSQGENMGNYLKTLFNENGYSFARLCGIGRETAKIDEIVIDVKKGISLLKKEKSFNKIILVGTSAGGTISLLAGYSNYGEKMEIDGIIALYPLVDISHAYDYYTNSSSNSLLDKLGDKIYCSLYKTEKDINTFALASKKLMVEAFGERTEENKLYENSVISNIVTNNNIPTLLISGSIDSMAITQDTKILFNKMVENNIICSYLELPSVEHAYDIANTIARKRAIKEMEGFITALF